MLLVSSIIANPNQIRIDQKRNFLVYVTLFARWIQVTLDQHSNCFSSVLSAFSLVHVLASSLGWPSSWSQNSCQQPMIPYWHPGKQWGLYAIIGMRWILGTDRVRVGYPWSNQYKVRLLQLAYSSQGPPPHVGDGAHPSQIVSTLYIKEWDRLDVSKGHLSGRLGFALVTNKPQSCFHSSKVHIHCGHLEVWFHVFLLQDPDWWSIVYYCCWGKE